MALPGKQSNSLLSVPKRSNSMRPPSIIPLSSSSSSRLNRLSEITPSAGREASQSLASVTAKTRRTENQSPSTVNGGKTEKQISQFESARQTFSRPSSSASNRSTETARPARHDNDAPATNKETNIQVVVRCRGRNDREIRENSGVIVASAPSRKEVTVQTGPLAHSNKTYSFDHVFGPEADQAMVYDEVVAPILEEALAGYNCTIFAYGQTGTGKTYTMSGDVSENFGIFANHAGIIPRVLYRLFLALETEQSEYSVKCSFIELYNEELRDLISKEDDKKVKIFEDSSKKGIIIQGMEESFIKTAAEGLKILQDGSIKRQVAATKCNDLSSRSHSVFTVTVHVKEMTGGGEEFVRIGKLNLVDLAGSENISRSGAENKRAREAGMINQSLLTLGRVINALVDRSSHIPYRESKLTRLLQDSLGGRTKTCIIATISPAKMNLEETISTLDYASRAKNIRNKPQLNQVMSKKTLIKEYINEIERLKADLMACRQKNGVYISAESYQEITEENESRRVRVEEQQRKIEVMETQLRTTREQIELSMKSTLETRKELEITQKELANTRTSLHSAEKNLVSAQQDLRDEQSLRHSYEATEFELGRTAEALIATVKEASSDVSNLNSAIDKRAKLDVDNRNMFLQSQRNLFSASKQIEDMALKYTTDQTKLFESMSEQMRTMLVEETAKLGSVYKSLENCLAQNTEQEKQISKELCGSKADMNTVLDDIKVLREDIKSKVGEGLSGLGTTTEKISQELLNQLEVFQSQTSTAYNRLGRDFKSIFDDVQKHLHSQNAAIERFHEALLLASSNASAAFDNGAHSVLQMAEEEAKLREQEKTALISQVNELLEVAFSAQQQRFAGRSQEMHNEFLVSKTSLDTAGHDFVSGVSGWLNDQSEFQQAMLQNKDRIKQQIIESYRQAEQQGDMLQTCTRAIHAESVKIVDSQKENLGTQMQVLDGFVVRAKEQNEMHYAKHTMALTAMNQAVRNTLPAANKTVEDTGHALHTYVDESFKVLEAGMSRTHEYGRTSTGELVELRDSLMNLRMQEYMPTGQTPKKTKVYNTPTSLPRTIHYHQEQSGELPGVVS
ncbi:P-loop containing nucleoside triphosphate hydrolase protein [Limtongia smithiae]|uniref:P-loop containing nucleoside triphosphate hydrolase protein n=1 Tax=Limtongia smithiae TaxID=1125753 RepID=UPI0034CE6EF6